MQQVVEKSDPVLKNKGWLLERYARYISPPSSLTGCDEDKSGTWQHQVSKEGAVLQLSIVNSEHLLVTNDSMVLESFTLWESQKWLKAIVKGDSIMFMYRDQSPVQVVVHICDPNNLRTAWLKAHQKENRRFRVKLSSSAEGSSLEACRDVVTALAPLLSVQNVSNSYGHNELSESLSQVVLSDSQDTQVDLTQSCDPPDTIDHTKHNATGSDDLEIITTGELAKKLLIDTRTLSSCYESTQFPTQQLPSFIKLCLTDSKFPAFVEAVDKVLAELTEDI